MTGFDSKQPRKRRQIGETIDPKKSIAIYCEGQTEKIYFQELKKYYRITNVNIIPIVLSEQGNALTLTQNAVDRKNENPNFDEYWIVIDKDDTEFPIFEKAINLAKEKQISSAYSIQAFEFWFILHFQYSHDKMERTDYSKKLNNYLKHYSYGKSKNELEKVCTEILPLTKIGIKNAKQGLSYFEENEISLKDRESLTLVFEVIESILKGSNDI